MGQSGGDLVDAQNSQSTQERFHHGGKNGRDLQELSADLKDQTGEKAVAIR
jgi:hypothetical protein